MKQPDEPNIGGSRKTLPTRKARKVHSGERGKLPQPKKPSRKNHVLDKDAELELVKAFGEK
jgi:hypothetical protein